MKTRRIVVSYVMITLLLLQMMPSNMMVAAASTTGENVVEEHVVGEQEEQNGISEEQETEEPEIDPDGNRNKDSSPAASRDKTQERSSGSGEKDDDGGSESEADSDQAASESSADYVAAEVKGKKIEAADVQGSAAADEQKAAEQLEKEEDLSLPKAEKVASNIFLKANAPTGPELVDDYPRQGDGSNIESISAKWITEDTTENNDDSLLYIKPNGDAKQSVRLQINYALSGEHNYNPGDVTVTIPAYIFHKRNGQDTGNLIIPFPEDPSMKSDFNWKLVGDTYVLTNTKMMSAATKGYIQFAINNLTPHEIVDMQETDRFNATIEVVTHKDNIIALRSNSLTAQIDTEAILTRANKRVSSSPYFTSASNIPESQRIEGEEEYVVVNWYTWSNTRSNTEYVLDVKDIIPDEYDGFIIGADSEDGLALDNKNVFTGWTDGDTKYYYFKTAYPGSQFRPDTTYTFHNHSIFTVTEVDPEAEVTNHNVDNGEDPAYRDPQKVTTAEADASTSFRYSDPKWVKPTGHFMVTKNGNDDKVNGNLTHNPQVSSSRVDTHLWNTSPSNGWYGLYPTGINYLQDQYEEHGIEGGIRLSYTIDSVGYVMPWMFNDDSYDTDHEMAPRKSINYNRPVTMITKDTGISIGRNGGKLTIFDDYEFVSVEFPEVPYVYKGVPHNINADGSWSAIHAGDGTFNYSRDYDKSNWPDITMEIQRNGEWEPWATASWKHGGDVRITMADGTALPEGNGVVDVPSDTENFRTIVTLQNTSTDTKANTCLQAAINYDVRPVIKLKSTEKMHDLIEAAFENSYTPSLQVWNTTNMIGVRADEEEGSADWKIVDLDDDGYDVLRGYTTDTAAYPYKSATQSLSDVDYENRQVTIHYSARVEEKSFINDKKTYWQAVEDGKLLAETHGIWRDLLPVGVTPILSTIRLRSDDSIKDVQTIENFRGSGRTLLIVEADLTPTLTTYRANDLTYYQDVPSIRFDAVIDFDSITDYGDELHNVISFESSNEYIGTIENYTGEPDDPYADNNVSTKRAFIDKTEKDLMVDLDDKRDDPSFLYAGVETKLDILSAARTSLSKDVQVNNDGYWSDGTYYTDIYGEPVEAPVGRMRTVYEGGFYKYRLRMMSDDETISKDLVIYDSLENFYAMRDESATGSGNDPIDVDAPRWQGEFMGVDVSQLAEQGCAPVVYYSLVEGLELSDENDPNTGNAVNMDLTNGDIWIRADEYNGPLSNVKAIAIDARKRSDGSDFSLAPLESATVIVNMHAPYGEAAREYISQKGIWGDSAHAYNNAYLTCTSIDSNTGIGDSENFVRKDYTKVGLEEFKLNITKVWDDAADRDGKRPESITFRLYANGEPASEAAGVYLLNDTVTLPDEDAASDEDTWRAEFNNIPYTDSQGEKIRYSIREEAVSGYSGTIKVNGMNYTFTNVHRPEKISIEGSKTWSGDTVSDRPDHIVVELYADGKFVQKKTVRPDVSGDWRYSFEDLYKYNNGEEIVYNVKEILEGKGASYTSETDGYDIINTYHPFGDLRVTKTVTDVTDVSKDTLFPFTFSFTKGSDEDVEPVTDTFSYTVYNSDDTEAGTGEVSDGDTISIRGGQYIIVSDIDEYVNYKVKEGTKDGFVQAAVSGDEGTIQPNEENKADFVNTYSANGNLNLAARKTLTDAKLKAYQFRFQLFRVDGEGEEETETLVRTASSSRPSETVLRPDDTIEYSAADVTFGAIRYTQEDAGKTYHYRMKEVDPGKPGYEDYDNTIYDVIVTVADNGDGTLDIDYEYQKDGEPIEIPAFRNHYTAEGKLDLRAWKDLKGGKLADGEFSFELMDEDGNVIAERTNTEDGSVLFDADTIDILNFDQEDIGKTIILIVHEKAGEKQSVNYDDNAYGYKIVVHDNEDGTLSFDQTHMKVQKEIDSSTGEERYNATEDTEELPVFTNTLKPGSLSVTKRTVDSEGADPSQLFNFRVKLIGEEIEDGEMTYQISQAAEEGASKEENAAEEAHGKGTDSQSGLESVHVLSGSSDSQPSVSYSNDNNIERSVGSVSLMGTGPDIASGTSGECTWTIDSEGTLTIVPTNGVSGVLGNFTGTHTSPWQNYKNSVKEVVVRDGVIANQSCNGMFAYLENCTSIDVTKLNTSNVTNMTAMFYRCTNLESIDVSNFDTSNVTLMGRTGYTNGMFGNCRALKALDLSNFDTSKVTNMHSMFSESYNLTYLDISSFDTSNVSDMDDIFTWNGAAGFQKVILGTGFDFLGNHEGANSRSALNTPPAEKDGVQYTRK